MSDYRGEQGQKHGDGAVKLNIRQDTKLKNQFGLSEWSGAVGDLGTMLPLAFALIVFNGFPVARLLLLWGVVYLITGMYYKVPVSVQPLKAMSVIAIAQGFSTEMLATTSFFYGLLLILLSVTGTIRWLQKWFTPALVKGIQLGIGLILAQKALNLVVEKGILLDSQSGNTGFTVGLFAVVVILLWAGGHWKRFPVVLIFLVGGIAFVKLLGASINISEPSGAIIHFNMPDYTLLIDAVILLMIPQLPLTLGNAVYAASDSCHKLWGKQAKRVTPAKLGLSIGIGDTIIGIMGGFPMCHGAGGMGAHAQFGARTGGPTIILGSIFILLALITPLSDLIFLIPVPILAAMLLFDSGKMISLSYKLGLSAEFKIAVIVGLVSFFTRNLSIALIVGVIAEQVWRIYRKSKIVHARPDTDVEIQKVDI